jgi:hypothetical protein
VVEDTDPTPVDQISWWKVVHTPRRPFGQKTNLLSHHHQGFGIPGTNSCVEKKFKLDSRKYEEYKV